MVICQRMIMKLHILTPHESRMHPIDFEVKRSKVKVIAYGFLDYKRLCN